MHTERQCLAQGLQQSHMACICCQSFSTCCRCEGGEALGGQPLACQLTKDLCQPGLLHEVLQPQTRSWLLLLQRARVHLQVEPVMMWTC